MKRERKAQVKLSFGMIFSIILIIVFIAFAFFAIQKFLGLGETISVGKFSDDIQSDVNKLWKSSQGSQEFEYSVPSGIEQVCFVNLLESERGAYREEDYYEEFEKYSPDKNLFFYPVDSTELNGIEIKHIELGGNNPDCFEVKNGKVKLGISKDFGEALVSMTGFSVEADLPIDSDGITTAFLTLALNGGNFQLIVPAGISVLTKNGAPLTALSIKTTDVNLDSSYSNVVGNVVYELQPDGANFDSPIEIQMSYDESSLPEGIDENDLIVKQISGGVEETVEIYSVDVTNNIVTAEINHFSSIFITLNPSGANVQTVQDSQGNPHTFIVCNDATCSNIKYNAACALRAHIGEDCSDGSYWVSTNDILVKSGSEYVCNSLTLCNPNNAIEGDTVSCPVSTGGVYSGCFNVRIIDNGDIVLSSGGNFVKHLYQTCLGREPETKGFNGWTNSLDQGFLTGKQVARGFVISEEFQNKGFSNEDFVTTLYRCLLGREPDVGGYNYHLDLLSNGGNRQTTLEFFLNSEEFTNYCSSYEITCGEEVPATDGTTTPGTDDSNPSCGTLGNSEGYEQSDLRCRDTCESGETNLGVTYDCGACCAVEEVETTKTKCSPAKIYRDFGKLGWGSCRTTNVAFEVVNFDYTGSDCRVKCGELGYLSWAMWGWDAGYDMDVDPTCWCGDGTVTSTHCTFRAGTCEPTQDPRECQYIYGDGYGGFHMWLDYNGGGGDSRLYWGGDELITTSQNPYDVGGYRYTPGDSVSCSQFEICRQPLSELPDCTKDWDCDTWCQDNFNLRFGECVRNKCSCENPSYPRVCSSGSGK